ncbi:MAG: chromosome condensation protein CrcB [Bacteroidetes bacterium 4572_112]|nr:MAG: chromosome condensation protein CrcB [Bacteroidetes bacterium 4572_112]
MQKLLFVALGGAIGSSLRYLISTTDYLAGSFLSNWRTFIVNILGSLIIGIMYSIFETTSHYNNLKIFIVIGILGGFTTFSSFALENINLIRDGEIKTAFIYILATNTLGIIAAFAGYFLYKQLLTINLS